MCLYVLFVLKKLCLKKLCRCSFCVVSSPSVFICKKGVHDRGFKCICVYSDRLEAIEALTSLVPEGVELHFDEVIGNDPNAPLDTIVGTLTALKYNIVAAMPGAETGVALADALSEALGVVTNGTELSAARRNKYLMGEAVRDAGVRAVMQLKVPSPSPSPEPEPELELELELEPAHPHPEPEGNNVA
jgi:hypothetical protein